MSQDPRVICRLDEIEDPASRAFTAGGKENWPLRGFVVKRAGQVYAYVNRCPHAGHPLNWQPDQFLSSTKTLILCCSHGAQFMIDTGVCVVGPCMGQELTRIAVHVEDGNVVLDEDPEILAARHA
jgi:nitrite reductase/ring-hydroxylating ferredoxin subunit